MTKSSNDLCHDMRHGLIGAKLELANLIKAMNKLSEHLDRAYTAFEIYREQNDINQGNDNQG